MRKCHPFFHFAELDWDEPTIVVQLEKLFPNIDCNSNFFGICLVDLNDKCQSLQSPSWLPYLLYIDYYVCAYGLYIAEVADNIMTYVATLFLPLLSSSDAVIISPSAFLSSPDPIWQQRLLLSSFSYFRIVSGNRCDRILRMRTLAGNQIN